MIRDHEVMDQVDFPTSGVTVRVSPLVTAISGAHLSEASRPWPRRRTSMDHLGSISFEIFTPRSAKGLEEFISPRGRLTGYASLGPRFISVSGQPSATATLKLLEAVKNSHCIRAQLHLPRAELTEESAIALIDAALRVGIVDALVLGSMQPAAGGSFSSAAELVGYAIGNRIRDLSNARHAAAAHEAIAPHPANAPCSILRTCRFLKARYGARLRVSVSGYPRGARGEANDHAADVAHTAKQIAAGAECVVCLPTFDAAAHTSYVAELRGAGVDVAVPVLPGILPLCAPAEFRRICHSLSVTPPAAIEERLTVECADAAAAKATSRTSLVALVRELSAAGASPPHVYSLNSPTLVSDLADAGFRPLKHRQAADVDA